MQKKLILLAFFMFIPSAASAADWRLSSGKPENFVELYDASAIDRAYDVHEVWFDKAYFVNRPDKVFDEKTLWRVNCSAKRLSMLESISYDFAGKVLDSIQIPDTEVEANRIIPDTRGEWIFRKVCEDPSSNELLPVRPASEVAKIYRKIRRHFPLDNSAAPFVISLHVTKEACSLNDLGIPNPQSAAAVCAALD